MFHFSPAAALDNGLGLVPPLGWSTWQTCGDSECSHDACTEQEIKEVATAMTANGMRDLGWSLVTLDDCWVSSARDPATSKLTWDTVRFPSGIPALADWLHARNFSFGLYTSAGNATCTNKPGSRDHYDLDASTFAQWSVDYVKLDWCGDIKKEITLGAAAHRNFSRAMNATGRPMFLETVAGYLFLLSGIREVANSWRFCTDHHDLWSSTKTQLLCRADQKLAKNAAGAPGGWPSLDFLMTGGAGCKGADHCPGQSDDAYRTEMAVWSLVQSPLLVDTDVRNMTAVMKEVLLNRDLIELHQSTATPPGKHLGYWLSCDEALACSIYGRMAKPDGSAWVLALVNAGKKSHHITASFGKLLPGWTDETKATVVDLWAPPPREENATAQASGSVVAEVPSHGTGLFRVERRKAVR